MSSTTKDPPKWRISQAKKLLLADLIANRCDGKDATEIYDMHKEEYHQYKFERFKANLKNLRDSVEKNQANAARDAEILAHDRAISTKPTVAAGGYPIWHKSEAEKQLKEAINNNEHKKMAPMKLREGNEEYEKFPKKVFRDHIYQETRERLSREYWGPIHRNKGKGSTKKKKDGPSVNERIKIDSI